MEKCRKTQNWIERVEERSYGQVQERRYQKKCVSRGGKNQQSTIKAAISSPPSACVEQSVSEAAGGGRETA